MDKCSKSFGKKEHVLNYACQRFQLSRPNKVGAVMALIRECQPASLSEWEEWYFQHAYTDTKTPIKLSMEILTELGERLYAKISEIIIPEWQAAFRELTLQDCIDYIYDLTISRTYDGYITEKSTINDSLAQLFPDVQFVETDPELDHAGDIDYTVTIGKYAIGIQVKPITGSANFGGFSLTERMQANFNAFTKQYGGKVFIVFSREKKITNTEVIDQIRAEIQRLQALSEE